MTPYPPKDANVNFSAPGCGDLPARREPDRIVTWWKMTEDQAREIKQGSRLIQLKVVGQGIAPVALSVISHWDGETPIRE